jgi:hypothetical protein
MKPAIPQLSEIEAAEYLGAKPQTLRTWRFRGVGPAFLKLMGKIKYQLPDLDAFIQKSRVEPGKPKRGRRLKSSK